MEDAETHATVGQCAQAREEVATGLALSRDNTHARACKPHTRPVRSGRRGAGVVDRVGDALPGSDADEPARAAGDRRRDRDPARRRGARARAARACAAVRPRALRRVLACISARSSLPPSEGRPRRCRGVQCVIGHRGEVPASMLYPLAYLGLARAAVLSNDTANARKAYDASSSSGRTPMRICAR